ncbi:hypothetical protein PENSPDRAFT_72660 [Peniophora sp. CONT]|nr:hypothetical protein PENSPDRAFT_72660 [Peniophora sp. CONT]
MLSQTPMVVDDPATVNPTHGEHLAPDQSTAGTAANTNVNLERSIGNGMAGAGETGGAEGGQDDEPMVSEQDDVEIVDDSALVEREEEDGDEYEEVEMSDIKASIKSAFKACKSGFQGTYATWQKYPSAPNPCMDIDGLGIIGLPLSAAEAERLRVRCNPAAFGKGERTVIDTSVRDTYELDGVHVQFGNPLWDGWLGEAMSNACEQLGVKGKQVRHELYKLLLYETGSHFHMHQDTEKSPGMFATVVIVLPSYHEGGSVHVKHGRQEKTLDSSGQGIATTSVLAWYTDVHHEVKPVTKGFRLALAFNLMHTGADVPMPRAPAFDDVFQKLEDALAAWQARDAAGESCPERLIHVLSHHYSQANVSFGHLKGVDSTLVNLLREVAELRGFCVALGHLNYSVCGTADDDYGGRWGNNDVSMGEVTDSGLSLQLISGTTGINIGRLQDIEAHYDDDSDWGDEGSDEAELLVDKEYWDNQRPDDKEYEGYQGNGAGGLELFYHRTVVVFWPKSRNISVVTSVGGRDIAIAELKQCSSARPTTAELSNVSLALTTGTPEVACMVADLSMQWQDPEIWHDALKSCKGESDIETLGMQRVQSALRLFNFSGMHPALDAIVSKTMSTRKRLQFVDELAAYNGGEAEEPLVPPAWIAERRRYVLSSLRTPEPDDIDPIVSLVTSLPDAMGFFCDMVLPQLKALNLSHKWWMAFTDCLRASQATAVSLPQWESPVFSVAKLTYERALLHSPSNRARFALLDELEASWSPHLEAIAWVNETRKWAVLNLTCPTADDVDLIMTLVRAEEGFFSAILCPTLQRFDYVYDFWPELLRRLQQLSQEDDAPLPEDWVARVAETLRSPLTKAQVQATSNAQVFATLAQLAAAAQGYEAVERVIREQKHAAMRTLKKPSVDETTLLLDELKRDIACGTTFLAPQLRVFKLELTFWENIVKVVRERSDEYVQAGWSREQLHTLLGDLVLAAASSTTFPPKVPEDPQPSRPLYYQHTSNAQHSAQKAATLALDTVKRLLWLCLRARHQEMTVYVFRKVFTTCTTADTVRSIIVPLVPVVVSVLQSWKLAIDTRPFDEFFRECIRSFITSVVGKRPGANETAQWARTLSSSCTCSDCTAINFQIGSSQKKIVWKASQSRRDHVSSQLRHLRELKLDTEYGGRGRMSDLVITKRVEEYEPLALWSKRSGEGMHLLRQLGQDASIHSVYAPAPGQLAAVLACLQGQAVPSVLTAAAFMAPQPVSNTATAASAAPPLGATPGSTVPRKRKAPPPNPEDVIEISD